MNEVYAALLAWAVALSGYPAPEAPPVIERVPHAFFVAHACGGHECRVHGWYAGGRVLYLHDRMDPQADIVAASVVVHEMVHYLQGIARRHGLPPEGAAYGERPDCPDAIAMEREAYAVQRQFLLMNASISPVGGAIARVGCEEG